MKKSKRISPRRTFTVREQLLGKLGPGGYGQLLERLEAQTAGQKKAA